MKSTKVVRTRDAFPPTTSGQWWTTRAWRWVNANDGKWYVCPVPDADPDIDDAADADDLAGRIGAAVDWRTPQSTVMHRELAELLNRWQFRKEVEAARTSTVEVAVDEGCDGQAESPDAEDNDYYTTDESRRDSLLPLIQRAGYLSTIQPFALDGQVGATRQGEPFEVWRDAVEEVGGLVDLLDIWKSKDVDAARDRFHWTPAEQPASLTWWKGGGINRPHEQVAKIPGGPWFRWPDEHPSEVRQNTHFRALYRLWLSDPLDFVFRMLAERVNQQLGRGIRLAIPLAPRRGSSPDPGPVYSPVPLSRAYLELTNELWGKATYRQCEQCHWWFEATRSRTGRRSRSDRLYCSFRCNKAHQRSKGYVPPQICALPSCQVVFNGVGQQKYCSREHGREGRRAGIRVNGERRPG